MSSDEADLIELRGQEDFECAVDYAKQRAGYASVDISKMVF